MKSRIMESRIFNPYIKDRESTQEAKGPSSLSIIVERNHDFSGIFVGCSGVNTD